VSGANGIKCWLAEEDRTTSGFRAIEKRLGESVWTDGMGREWSGRDGKGRGKQKGTLSLCLLRHDVIWGSGCVDPR
jgi:hypothetical protein